MSAFPLPRPPLSPPRRFGVRGVVIGLCVLALTACGGGGGGGPVHVAPLDFLHVTTPENSAGATSTLDHPRLNGNPDMIVIVTPVANPGGGFPRSFPGGPLTTEYDPATGRWTLVDLANSSGVDYAYHVSIFAPGDAAFRHATNAGNVSNDWTRLTHSLLNRHPEARALVTMHREVGSSETDDLNRHHIGMWYDTLSREWTVFNQDTADMPTGVGFDIVILPPGAGAYDHEATPANAVPGYDSETHLTAPWLDGIPNATVHVTPLWIAPGTAGTGGVDVDTLPVLVYWDPQWALSVNLPAAAPMPTGALFLIARIER